MQSTTRRARTWFSICLCSSWALRRWVCARPFRHALGAADEFFHTGQYEAIIPIVRLCTWLDPQQIDIYTTGAWHMDYNFVDESQRSDKRYIPPAVKLLEEGAANNPDIFDLYFELPGLTTSRRRTTTTMPSNG